MTEAPPRSALVITLSMAGAVVAVGFLAASAAMNFVFGLSLGRTPLEANIYGAVSVLAVLCNALCPFFLSWGWQSRRLSVAGAAGLLWTLCLLYSLTSALGFAAENRNAGTAARETIHANYDTAARHLAQLEARRTVRPTKDLDDRIERLRKEVVELRAKGGMSESDPQANLISQATFGIVEKHQVRLLLVALFAVMVEVGAALGLFAALAHLPVRVRTQAELPPLQTEVPQPVPAPQKEAKKPTTQRWQPPAQRKKLDMQK